MNSISQSKECKGCGVYKPRNAFYSCQSTKDGLRGKCKACLSAYRAQYRIDNRDRLCERERNNRRTLRLEVLTAYGGTPPVCACCGEHLYEFLCIDHINGGGKQHRATMSGQGTGNQIYSYLKMRGYPSGFRVLCHNCNMALGFYGYCPHNNVDSTLDS